MAQLETELLTDTWVQGTWEEYLGAIEQLDRSSEYYKSYYDKGQYRLEMAPLGFGHGSDHTLIALAIYLYCLARALKFQGLNGTSYRKSGYREVQPDASFYFGERVNIIPAGTSIVDLDSYPAPDLAIEVSNTTLDDDLGNKRLLYEELEILEYWVVDVRNARVIAFTILDRGSQRIEISGVLPGLSIDLLTEALQRSRQEDHGTIGRWLMQQFQG
jgi:Uma2 family endonuclease